MNVMKRILFAAVIGAASFAAYAGPVEDAIGGGLSATDVMAEAKAANINLAEAVREAIMADPANAQAYLDAALAAAGNDAELRNAINQAAFKALAAANAPGSVVAGIGPAPEPGTETVGGGGGGDALKAQCGVSCN